MLTKQRRYLNVKVKDRGECNRESRLYTLKFGPQYLPGPYGYTNVENLLWLFFLLGSISRDCCTSLWAPAVFPHSAATTGGKISNMPPRTFCLIFDKHFTALDKYSSAAWNCPWIAMTGARGAAAMYMYTYWGRNMMHKKWLSYLQTKSDMANLPSLYR